MILEGSLDIIIIAYSRAQDRTKGCLGICINAVNKFGVNYKARKDVRVAIACELYKREEISFGKACEIASVDMEEMKDILHTKGIDRKSGLEIKETENIAEEAVKFAGRSRKSY